MLIYSESSARSARSLSLCRNRIALLHELRAFIERRVDLGHPVRFLLRFRVHPAFAEDREFLIYLGDLLYRILVHIRCFLVIRKRHNKGMLARAISSQVGSGFSGAAARCLSLCKEHRAGIEPARTSLTPPRIKARIERAAPTLFLTEIPTRTLCEICITM